jgi:hypothetical protein
VPDRFAAPPNPASLRAQQMTQFEDQKARAHRAALNALRRTQRAAARSGVALSEWEGEFLGSVEDRVRKYGRAFADPDKGAPGTSLSLRQAVKLKEIAAKAKAGTAKDDEKKAHKTFAKKAKYRPGPKRKGGLNGLRRRKKLK